MSLYSGLNYGEEVHVHGELDAILKGYLDAVVSNPNKKLSTAWLRGYDGILNAYLGEKPEKFTWQGKEYTPMTFATDACGLNMDDYVSLTSFTHHPFYTQFALEVEDNWIGEMSYNLPLDELMEIGVSLPLIKRDFHTFAFHFSKVKENCGDQINCK
mgnify:CR=1 FL=1